MTLHRLAELLAGLRIPGGCPDCNATRTWTPAGWTTHHEDTCPDPWQRKEPE